MGHPLIRGQGHEFRDPWSGHVFRSHGFRNGYDQVYRHGPTPPPPGY
jgi:hypothetical protein